jgi:excisionase family DNA binding protein
MKTKSAYTTGEAARICNLSQTTIIRLFDAGTLKGYRVPGSRFRRITHEELERFLVEHALPNTLAVNAPHDPHGVDPNRAASGIVNPLADAPAAIDPMTSKPHPR